MRTVRESVPDERLLAQIDDVCRWYSASGPPTAQRLAAALIELAHTSGGRTGLLARHASRCSRHQDHKRSGVELREHAADLCIAVRADPSIAEQ